MEISAGLLIIKDNKILLCHPTNAPWKNTYSIPKGKVEKGESLSDTAIRETYEEVGIKIDKSKLDSEPHVIYYRSKNNKLYKKVYYFVVYDNNHSDIISSGNLQFREVDWAGFLDKDTAKEKIFWRFKEMLDFI